MRPALTDWNATINGIVDLIRLNREENITPVRPGRALTFVGNFANWCCSIMTESQIIPMQKDVRNLASTLEVISSSQAIEHKNIVEMALRMRNFSEAITRAETELRLNELRYRQDTLNSYADAEHAIKLTLQALQITTSLSEVLAENSQLENILAQCNQHLISPQLVDPQTLERHIAVMLQKPGYHGLELAVADVASLYMTKIAHCQQSPTEVRVFVRVPLRRVNNEYKIFRYHAIPFIWKNSICKVFDKPSILVAASKNEIIAFPEPEQNHCLKNHVCELPRANDMFTDNGICLQALLTERTVADAARHCNFHCRQTNTPEIIQLSTDEVLIANPSNSTIKVICGTAVTVQSNADHGVHKFTVPGNCSLSIHANKVFRERDVMPAKAPDTHTIELLLPALWTNHLHFDLDTLHDIKSSPTLTNDDQIVNDSWTKHVKNIYFTPQDIPVAKIPEITGAIAPAYSYFPLETEVTGITVIILVLLSIANSALLAYVIMTRPYQPHGPSQTRPIPTHNAPSAEPNVMRSRLSSFGQAPSYRPDNPSTTHYNDLSFRTASPDLTTRRTETDDWDTSTPVSRYSRRGRRVPGISRSMSERDVGDEQREVMRLRPLPTPPTP